MQFLLGNEWISCLVSLSAIHFVIHFDTAEECPKLIRRSNIIGIELVDFERFVFRIVTTFATNHSKKFDLKLRDRANSGQPLEQLHIAPDEPCVAFTLKAFSLDQLQKWVELLGNGGSRAL